MDPNVIANRLSRQGPVDPDDVATLNSYADLRNRALWAARIDRDFHAARELASECRSLLRLLPTPTVRT